MADQLQQLQQLQKENIELNEATLKLKAILKLRHENAELKKGLVKLQSKYDEVPKEAEAYADPVDKCKQFAIESKVRQELIKPSTTLADVGMAICKDATTVYNIVNPSPTNPTAENLYKLSSKFLGIIPRELVSTMVASVGIRTTPREYKTYVNITGILLSCKDTTPENRASMREMIDKSYYSATTDPAISDTVELENALKHIEKITTDINSILCEINNYTEWCNKMDEIVSLCNGYYLYVNNILKFISISDFSSDINSLEIKADANARIDELLVFR